MGDPQDCRSGASRDVRDALGQVQVQRPARADEARGADDGLQGGDHWEADRNQAVLVATVEHGPPCRHLSLRGLRSAVDAPGPPSHCPVHLFGAGLPAALKHISNLRCAPGDGRWSAWASATPATASRSRQAPCSAHHRTSAQLGLGAQRERTRGGGRGTRPGSCRGCSAEESLSDW